MKKRLNITDAATKIICNPAPLLLLDTCAVLDIMRAPFRAEIQGNVIPSAINLIKAAQSNPRGLWLVASSLVCDEIYDSLAIPKFELEKVIKDIDDIISGLNNAISIIGPYKGISRFCDQRFNLAEDLMRIASDIASEVIVIDISDDQRVAATHRVAQCKPPAKKGGQLNDCLIIEHYLELCKQLRIMGFDNNCVFTSSNKNDYCRNGCLAPSLKIEFDAVQLNYSGDLAWAKSLLI